MVNMANGMCIFLQQETTEGGERMVELPVPVGTALQGGGPILQHVTIAGPMGPAAIRTRDTDGREIAYKSHYSYHRFGCELQTPVHTRENFRHSLETIYSFQYSKRRLVVF